MGARHPDIVGLRKLIARRSERRARRRYVVDGPVLVAEALAAGGPVETIYAGVGVDLDRLGASPEPGRGPRIVRVAEGVLERILDPVTPRPVAAVVAMSAESPDLAGLLAGSPQDRPVLALVGVADPGNAGTLLRSAEAFGCAAVIATAGTVDLVSPKCVRAAAGSTFRVPWHDEAATAELITAAERAGRAVVASVARGGVDADSLDWPPGAVVCVGNEAHGLPEDVIDAADIRVTIPLEGDVESLNAAMAGTLLLHLARRRGVSPR